jgi:hypothetical protein
MIDSHPKVKPGTLAKWLQANPATKSLLVLEKNAVHLSVMDRDGNLVELDDDEVVRDGQVLRVPMTFMDATQRSMAQADEQRQRVLDAYAAFNQNPNQPSQV